jgi:uncharacterized membrane protein
MIRIGAVYILAGLMFAAVAVLSARDRQSAKRIGNTVFWGLLAVSFLFGDRLGDFGNGMLVLALAASGAMRWTGPSHPASTTAQERLLSAVARGNRLFLPALAIPALALVGTLFLKRIDIGGGRLIDPGQATPISLALGIVVALTGAMVWLRPPLAVPLQEARRLIDSIGWATILPQMLAALGAVFALSGVGDQVGRLMIDHMPLDTRFGAVAAYTIGMALFTMVMGNGFAAFPVMTAAVGLPLIVGHFGGDPAVMAALGMLSGFCGTLVTPMAANFNIVPVVLLDLRDRNAVIKAQAPTALGLLAVNTLLMYFLAFR